MTAIITEVSDKFIPNILHREERDVLRAYRCPAGIWTIGPGLTAASGVVKPRKGMVITKAESLRLTLLAIARNYAPRVTKHLQPTKQHVFDGGVSFDWNTGRIHNASWVAMFLKGDYKAARKSFMQWVRGGGRVLPGLEKRRETEWQLIEFGIYPGPAGTNARLTTIADHTSEFKALGYDPKEGVSIIKAFQVSQNLTVDGLIGPATRAALIRAVQAKRQGQATATGGVGGTGVAGGTEVATNPQGLEVLSPDAALWVLGAGIGAAALVFTAFLVWRYRGPLFAWLPDAVKDFFERFGLVLGRRIPT